MSCARELCKATCTSEFGNGLLPCRVRVHAGYTIAAVYCRMYILRGCCSKAVRFFVALMCRSRKNEETTHIFARKQSGNIVEKTTVNRRGTSTCHFSIQSSDAIFTCNRPDIACTSRLSRIVPPKIPYSRPYIMAAYVAPLTSHRAGDVAKSNQTSYW